MCTTGCDAEKGVHVGYGVLAPHLQVKASSNAYKNNIAFIRGGDELMVLAGWRSRVSVPVWQAG